MWFRRIVAIALVLIIVMVVVVSLRHRHRVYHGNVTHVANGYEFGLVTVDTVRHEVSLPARVARDTGHVLLLLNLTGYPWLDDSAALTSPARLLDLQQAIASLDWALWDSLWTGKRPGRPMTLRFGTLEADQVATPIESGPSAVSRQPLADVVFLGMPEFDPAVLESGEDPNCRTCPAFSEESRMILEVLRRRNGAAGYQLRPGVLPKPGAGITITIQIP
jgi:hypothetical protein